MGTLKTDGALVVAGAASVTSLKVNGVTIDTNGGAGGASASQTLFVRKTADESRTATTVLANDAQLSIALAANGVYTMQMFLIYDGPTTGDISMGLSVPSGASIPQWNTDLISTALGASTTIASTNKGLQGSSVASGGTGGVGTKLTAQITGLIVTGGTAGNLNFQWAQLTSDPAATTVYSGTYIVLTKVS